MEIGGRLASLAIDDWLSGHLVDGFQDWKCPELRRPTARHLSEPGTDHDRHLSEPGTDHDLIVVPSRTWTWRQIETRITSMCRYCRYHFIFVIKPDKTGSDLTDKHPMHHFICVSAQEPVRTTPTAKLYPLESMAYFRCSCCSMTVVIEVSSPRLKPDWVGKLLDLDRARQALEKAKAQDPIRFPDDPGRDEIMIKSGAKNLNQYLRDILSKDSVPRRISFRNKNYMVQFGEELKPMFEHLGFKEDQNKDGESCWISPTLPPQEEEGVTDVGSERAFYEDVRSEVQSYLEENPTSDSPEVKQQASARGQLLPALLSRMFWGSPGSAVPEEEKPDLRTLGASVNTWTDDSLLKYAYERQVNVDPENSQLFVDALSRLAEKRHYNLQEFAVTKASLLSTNAVTKASLLSTNAEPERSREQAYTHFSFSSEIDFEDSSIIQQYALLRRTTPAESHVHRKYLLVIGRDRKSDSIVKAAYADEMDTTEAYNMFSVQPDASMDGIAAQAVSSIENDELDRKLAIMALDVISRERAEADQDRVFFDDTLSEMRSRYENDTRAKGGSTRSLPPGLSNLRNTCYLNSILQYLYSVKAVRDLVLNLERAPLEPNEQVLLDRYGSSELEPGAAFVGHEFARELNTLFRDMETSTNGFVIPRQRLAEAALLRPLSMHQTSQEAPAVPKPPAAPTRAPPLPPRTGERADTKVSIEPVLEGSETASDVSSQTLVNQPDDETSSVAVEKDAPDPPVEQSKRKRTVEELAEALNKSDVSGTDQMDVDEVLGYVCDHLSDASKVEQLEKEDAGNVADPIKEAFFSKFFKYISNPDGSTWGRTSPTDRSVRVFPAAEGNQDIYQLLGRVFSLEAVETLDKPIHQFLTIEKPAPHFQIYIQRLNAPGGEKNKNPIDIPDTLYLDRFMDSCHADAEMQRANKRAADIDTRINELKKLNANRTQGSNGQSASQDTSSVQPQDIDEFLFGDDLGGSAPDRDDERTILTDPTLKELFASFNIDITTLNDTAEHNKVEAGSDAAAEQSEAPSEQSRSDIAELWNKDVTEMQAEMQALVGERTKIFDKVRKEVEYRLHAVFCHSGTGAAGHYWVWIHDFERGDWLKYNDTTVSVHTWAYVHREISTTEHPCLLAYVRARDISEHVDIPLPQTGTQSRIPLGRQTETQSKVPLGPQQKELLGLFHTPKDTHMDDAEEAPTTEHLEHAPMLGDNGESRPAPAA
ncbi:ubiquitin carboxyl-terminal hydrolase 2 [Rhypophila sp. PSN 637]